MATAHREDDGVQGQGIAELVAELKRHRAWMADGGELGRRRHARAAAEIEAIAVSSLRRQLDGVHGGSTLACLADAVSLGEPTPTGPLTSCWSGSPRSDGNQPRSGPSVHRALTGA